MSRWCFLLFAMVPFLVFAQNWQPLNSSISKSFLYSDGSGEVVSLVMDTAYGLGSDTTFVNFKYEQTIANPSFPPYDTCVFWGGGCIARPIGVTWLGDSCVWMNNHLSILNYQSDTIDLDFSLNLGGTALTYQDSVQSLLLKFDSIGVSNVLGQIDSIRFYSLIHVDTSGAVALGLNALELSISKKYGFVKVFDFYNFPSRQSGMEMYGCTEDSLGVWVINNEVIHDVPIGTIYQMRETVFDWMVTWTYVTTHTTYEVVSKTYVSNGVNIEYAVDTGASTITILRRNDQVVANLPFEGYQRKLVLVDSCGLKLPIYQSVYDPFIGNYAEYGYPAPCDCWGLVDNSGFGCNVTTTRNALGLGLLSSASWMVGAPWCDYTDEIPDYLMTYFELNGQSCGHYVNSVDELPSNFEVSIYPNPSLSKFRFDLPKIKPDMKLVVVNSLGQIILEKVITEKSFDIDLTVSAGLYSYQVQFENAILSSGKLLVE
jgi:hypothetical protein